MLECEKAIPALAKTVHEASREIDRQKDALLDEISRRLEQKLEQEPLFTLRWPLS